MGKKKLLAIAAAVLVAAPFATHAQQADDKGLYIGGTFGQSDADVDCTGTASCDTKGTAWRILGGYQLNRNFAVEFGYHDFGDILSARITAPIAARVNAEANAWEVLAVGSLPLNNQFSIYGKGGLYRGEVKASASITGVGSGSIKETNTDLTFGIGAQFNISRQVGLRGEWQRYTNMGDNSTIGEGDVDVLSVGVVFKF